MAVTLSNSFVEQGMLESRENRSTKRSSCYNLAKMQYNAEAEDSYESPARRQYFAVKHKAEASAIT